MYLHVIVYMEIENLAGISIKVWKVSRNGHASMLLISSSALIESCTVIIYTSYKQISRINSVNILTAFSLLQQLLLTQ